MKRVIGRLSLLLIEFIFLPSQGNYNRQDVHQPDDCIWHPAQTVIVSDEEQKKRWRDIDNDRRQQLRVQILFHLESLSLSGHSRLL